MYGPKTYATPSDFPKSNLDLHSINNPVNTTAGLTIGDRFFQKKLGWILAASYNDIYKGTNSLIFDEDQSPNGTNLPVLSDMQQRMDYTHQQNYGIHNKLDFAISPHNSIQLYTAYMGFRVIQVRDIEETSFSNDSYSPQTGNEELTHTDMNRFSTQSLFNTTLQGEHTIAGNFSVQWSAVYSEATHQAPDNSTVVYDQNYVDHVLQPQYVDFLGSDRLWLHNTDIDKAGYLNLKYKANIFGGKLEIKTGGLYRDKERTSFFNDYTLMPKGPTSQFSAKGINWNYYSEINWTVQDPLGAVNTPGTFDAYEKVLAKYGMLQYEIKRLRIIGGLREEDTRQGYNELFHNVLLDELNPGNNQKADHVNDFFLPSVNARYAINDQSNIKASYYKAINKPNFLEIVPYVDNTGDYPKVGNPNLKDALADNYDLRYEFFPDKLDQLLAGVFYKKINNAIEEGFFSDGHGDYNLSTFNSNATNYGFEADIIKFYREFGIKANYTWTESTTSSYKRAQVNGKINRDSTISVLQYRPLDGQSKNVGNLSLLYRGTHNGLNAQLALSYTGTRIYKVSPDLNGDYWQKGFWQLDLSAEKKLKHGLGIFIKAHNLLNTHVIVYLKEVNPVNAMYPDHSASDNTTLIRDAYSEPSYLIGIRYKFNK